MTGIYHNDGGLIIINKSKLPQGTGHSRGEEIMRMVRDNGGIHSIYAAHEIWYYNNATKKFNYYKNKGGLVSLLKSFLAEKGVNVRCDAATLNSALPSQYCFEDEKDEFLFHLRFGS